MELIAQWAVPWRNEGWSLRPYVSVMRNLGYLPPAPEPFLNLKSDEGCTLPVWSFSWSLPGLSRLVWPLRPHLPPN